MDKLKAISSGSIILSLYDVQLKMWVIKNELWYNNKRLIGVAGNIKDYLLFIFNGNGCVDIAVLDCLNKNIIYNANVSSFNMVPKEQAISNTEQLLQFRLSEYNVDIYKAIVCGNVINLNVEKSLLRIKDKYVEVDNIITKLFYKPNVIYGRLISTRILKGILYKYKNKVYNYSSEEVNDYSYNNEELSYTLNLKVIDERFENNYFTIVLNNNDIQVFKYDYTVKCLIREGLSAFCGYLNYSIIMRSMEYISCMKSPEKWFSGKEDCEVLKVKNGYYITGGLFDLMFVGYHYGLLRVSRILTTNREVIMNLYDNSKSITVEELVDLSKRYNLLIQCETYLLDFNGAILY